jgi:hypothetical protein
MIIISRYHHNPNKEKKRMSSRAANITYQEVVIAIETLILKGENVTNQNVRCELAKGDPLHKYRGSPQKVGEYIKQYFESTSYTSAFQEKHLSRELTAAMVAEIKTHMASNAVDSLRRLESAEADRDEFLKEIGQMTDERDGLLEKIKTAESLHGKEIKLRDENMVRLAECVKRWEEDYQKVKEELEKTQQSLVENIGLLAVAQEQAKPAVDLKGRLQIAETKNSEYITEISQLNRDLRDALIKASDLEKELLRAEKSPKQK